MHTHTKYDSRSKISRLKIALILTIGGAILELAGGLISKSLALVSDAGHMMTHVFALGTSYFAVVLTLKPATKTRTYGLYRAEVLAAFVNGVFLIVVAGYIFYESLKRFINPLPVKVGEMFGIAVIGLLINGATTLMLARVKSSDINIKSAFIHEIGDMMSSAAVVGAAVLISITGNYIFDPALSFVICALIVIWAVKLLIDSANILLEATPRHLDIDEIVETIRSGVAGVHEIHHVHVWTISSSMYALTAHIVIDDCHISKANEVLHKINKLAKDRFNIGHTNIQFECLIKPAESFDKSSEFGPERSRRAEGKKGRGL